MFLAGARAMGAERGLPMPSRRALVLNAGSSTLKWSVLEMAAGQRLVAEGSVEWRGSAPEDKAEQVRAVLRESAAARSAAAAGHRVVHGGAAFRGPVLVTPAVRLDLAVLVEVYPLHAPAG